MTHGSVPPAASLGRSGDAGLQRDSERRQDLGLLSLVEGQGTCLANFLKHERLVSALSVNIIDDASMWVRRLLTPEEAAAVKAELAGRGDMDPFRRKLLNVQLNTGKPPRAGTQQ